MTANEMEKIYVNDCLANDTWDSFWAMKNDGRISEKEWNAFIVACADLVFEGMASIINADTGRCMYALSNNGIWIKCR